LPSSCPDQLTQEHPRRMEKQFLQHKSCKSQVVLEEAAAFALLKKNGLSGRDLKLIEKYLETDTIVMRPIILARPANNFLLFFMEHIKLVSFQDFCLILSPLNNWTHKFIVEDLVASQDNDFNGNNSDQPFIFQILEKALESIMKKFKKNLKLIKPPLTNLLNMIETNPNINGLKMLLALKKSLSPFQQSVENVSKVLKHWRLEKENIANFNFGNQSIGSDDLEHILDFFIADIEEIEGEVKMVDEMMEDTDQFVSAHQDNVRNELMKVSLVIEILAVTLGFGAVVGGIFGMNVPNHMEENPIAFTFILVGMCLFMVFMFGGFLLKYYYLKRDTSKAQSYNVLRNFFKYADLLEFEFQQFPEKNIKKEDFIESVTRITGMTLNEKDADFLFDMVDSNNDGVISTDTELILDLKHLSTRGRKYSRRVSIGTNSCFSREEKSEVDEMRSGSLPL